MRYLRNHGIVDDVPPVVEKDAIGAPSHSERFLVFPDAGIQILGKTKLKQSTARRGPRSG